MESERSKISKKISVRQKKSICHINIFVHPVVPSYNIALHHCKGIIVTPSYELFRGKPCSILFWKTIYSDSNCKGCFISLKWK